MTQLEMTTSTELSGSGIASMWPLRKWTLVDAGLRRLAGRGRASRRSCRGRRRCRRGDAAGGEQDVDAAAGAEVEHHLPGCRSASAVGLPQPREAISAFLGQLVQPVAVEAAAEEIGLFVGDDRRVGAAAPGRLGRVRSRERGRGVTGADCSRTRLRRPLRAAATSARRARPRSMRPCRSARSSSWAVATAGAGGAGQ